MPDGPAKGPWYDHKGFFEHKLAEPNVYDQGKIKSEMEKLRMPNLHLTKEQIRALTTFLLGSQEVPCPIATSTNPGTPAAISRKAGGLLRSTTAWDATSSSPGKELC